MDFSLTDDQRRLRDAARDFAEGAFAATARELEEADRPLAADERLRLGEHGFLGVNLAPEHGGLGLDDLTAVVILEEFAKLSPALAFPVFESSFGPAKAIERFASEPLKRRILPLVCQGRAMVSIAMSEPGARLGPDRPHDPRQDRGRGHHPQRAQAVVQRRRPCRRLPGLLPPVGGARAPRASARCSSMPARPACRSASRSG